MYNADIGRFLSPDTIVPEPGNPQSLNRYSYVNNNPIRYNDPTGHCMADIYGPGGCLGKEPHWVPQAPVIIGATANGPDPGLDYYQVAYLGPPGGSALAATAQTRSRLGKR
jgi:hypothetical protein